MPTRTRHEADDRKRPARDLVAGKPGLLGREIRLGQVSEARQRLVKTAHAIGFGRFDRLMVQAGEPRLEPPCRVFRTLKFPSTTQSLPQLGPTSVLKAPWPEVFAAFEEMGTGEIERLEIQGGLPTRGAMEVTMPDPK